MLEKFDQDYGKDAGLSQEVTNILELDDLDRKENSNELLESTITTLSNLSEEVSL
jgi:hypothetical protein